MDMSWRNQQLTVHVLWDHCSLVEQLSTLWKTLWIDKSTFTVLFMWQTRQFKNTFSSYTRPLFIKMALWDVHDFCPCANTMPAFSRGSVDLVILAEWGEVRAANGYVYVNGAINWKVSNSMTSSVVHSPHSVSLPTPDGTCPIRGTGHLQMSNHRRCTPAD